VRQLGLAADYLYAVEVVTVDAEGRARPVVATREESDPHRELWWAHTPHPARARLKSLVTHIVFGVGLYVCALGVSYLLRAHA
jgi:hypothetical protein